MALIGTLWRVETYGYFFYRSIVRVLMMVLASVIAITYLMAQMWQRVPQMPLGFKFYDYIVFGIVGFAFGLGLNNQ